MILKWGSYAHDQDEVGIRITHRDIFDTFGRRMGSVQDWHILGAKHAASQSALTTALENLETAYNTDYGDLILYLNDGITATAHQLINADTFGGTHRVGFGYIDGPWKMRTEYANQRTFWAIIRGETRTGSGQWAWREQVSIRGTGGNKWRYMPQLNGAPTAQILQTQTPFYYVQRGMAIGRQAYIAPPGPLYPGIEHTELRQITYHTPRDMRWGPANEMYLTEWAYFMEATVSAGFTAFIVPPVT